MFLMQYYGIQKGENVMKRTKLARLLTTAVCLSILIGVHNGKIALWRDGDPEPFKVFPYRASMLPDEQEQMLKKGIRVESMEDLQRLLENYLS